MRTLFKSIFAALPAVAFWACSNPDIFEELRPSIGETINLTISTDRPDMVDTRTMVAEDGKTPMWCPEDAIGVSVFAGGSYTNHEFTNDTTDAPSVKTSFSGSVAVGNMIYTYYPYTKGNVTADGQISMTIPDVQYPTPTSFDGAADILVGKPVEITPATTTVEGLQFKRVGGFLKIVLKDATSGQVITGEAIESVSVTAQSTLAGYAYLDIVNGELDKIHANRSVKVTAKYSYTDYKIGDEKSAAYLGVYPQILAKGSTIIISAKTAFYDIEREIELPVDIEINAGGITTLTVNIDEANIYERTLYIDEIFPDPIFRQYVLDNFDTDHDGILSKDEMLAVTKIDVSKSYSTPTEEKIASLEGIQYFANLEYLDCYNNQLTTLDVSQNTALTTLYCDANQLTTLDVSQNTALTSLACGSNQLAALDLSKNTALIYLSCEENQLTTLDVSNNTALRGLYCLSNQFTTLDVSKNTALRVLSCEENQLTTLDVSKNTALTTLWCYNNQLTALDLSNNTALTYLRCEENQLTTLDLSNNTALGSLSCSFNQLTTLDLSKNTALTYLECSYNQLTTLDLSNNTALKWLFCNSNQLTTLDVSKTNLGNSTDYYPLHCASMETLQTLYLKKGWEIKGITTDRNSDYIPDHTEILFVDEDGNIETDGDIEQMFPDPIFRQYVLDNFDTDHNGILSKEECAAVTEINVNKYYYAPVEERIASLEGVQYFTNLTTLLCDYNQLTTLDLSNNTVLTSLDCHNNKLTTLDVSGCTALTYLSCYENQLTTLDLSNNTALTELYCRNNQLTTLDVSNNTALKELNCYRNQLTTLDLSKNSALTVLYCGVNQLTTLDVSGCTALTSLDCDDNQLTTLDLPKNSALTVLYCDSNHLTTLDVAKNTALTELRCQYNQLTTLDLPKNSALTVLYCGVNQLTTLDLSNNTALTELKCNDNQLTTLDLPNNTALETLDCSYNQLTTLDVSKNTALTELKCYANQLTTLDVSKNTALKWLFCNSNQLTTLDLSNNTALEFLSCGVNQLTTLDVSKTNLGNSTNFHPLYCAPMKTLKTLYLKTGWEIPYITPNRDSRYIPDHTNIEFVN